MNNLTHYHKGSRVLISPLDKDLALEVEIVAKAQGRGKEKSRVKVHSDFPTVLFGERQKVVGGMIDVPRDTAWLSADNWRVIGKVTTYAQPV